MVHLKMIVSKQKRWQSPVSRWPPFSGEASGKKPSPTFWDRPTLRPQSVGKKKVLRKKDEPQVGVSLPEISSKST